MKRRAFCILFLVVLLSLFCGYDWPPKPYDMPKTLLTAELVGSYLGGLFNSIRAIGNMGFIISMVLAAVFIIPVFVRKVYLKDFWERQAINKAVSKNEFSRSVRAADRAKNRETIINERVAEMEINSEARKRFHSLHRDDELEERLYQRELSYSAQIAFLDNHPEMKKRRRRR